MKEVLAALVLATAASLAQAQSAPPHDQVFDLATIQAAHDVCGFDLTDEQLEVVDQRRQSLADHDGISTEEMTAVTGQVTASLQRQMPEGVCKPNGPEALLYKRKLAEYGLL